MRLTRDERGVTLIEVLVAITILGIIMLPLGNALIAFFVHTDATTARLNESHDVQIAAAYFAQDVQSVGTRDWAGGYPYPLRQSVELDVPFDSGLYPCGNPGTPDAVVRLAWDDPDSPSAVPSVKRVAYVVMVVGTQRQLHRFTCRGSSVPVDDVVLAHTLDATDPVVTCPTACTAAPAVPLSVTLTLTIQDPASTGPPLTVDLNGQRRQT